MKGRIFSLITTVVALFAILSSLGSFHIAPLESASKTPLTPFVKKEKELALSYRCLSASESRLYLDVNLLKEGLQPVQITVENNTPRTYEIASDSIDVPHATGQQAAWKVTRHSLPRSILYKVISFFFTPFLVVETLDSVLTFKGHLDLRRDFNAKSLKDRGEVILPYSSVNRVVFIPIESYSGNFTITVTDVNNGKTEAFST